MPNRNRGFENLDFFLTMLLDRTRLALRGLSGVDVGRKFRHGVLETAATVRRYERVRERFDCFYIWRVGKKTA